MQTYAVSAGGALSTSSATDRALPKVTCSRIRYGTSKHRLKLA